MRILLVDDDSFLREMYVTKFSEAGHEVHAAKSGEDALEALQGGTFDAVLLDMVMPGVTGEELLRRIRDEQLGGSPKCIVLSNQGEEVDVDTAKKLGAVGYIVKAERIPSEVVSAVEEMAG